MELVAELSRDARERILIADQADLDGTQALGEIFQEAALSGRLIPDEAELATQIKRQLFEYGVLQPFLNDPMIEEIWINRPHEIRYARGGQLRSEAVQLDAETIRTLVLRMLRRSGRRIDTSLPFADAVLEDGSRLHVVIPEVTATNWAVNIRKFPESIISMAQLVECGTLTKQQADYLREAAIGGHNILISGATHTGKTTLLAAILNELPQSTRLISCEETFELRSQLADWVAMQARQPNLEGQGEIPLRRLVKESLRMRPDRLVIGEVREAEALDLLIAMNSGVSGACTIHANSAEAAITKLCTLPLLAGPNISSEFVKQTVADAVDLVVHCIYLPTGQRRVTQLATVSVSPDGSPRVQEVAL